MQKTDNEMIPETEEATMQRGCQAPRKDGKPCSAPALVGRDYCFSHDPKNQKQKLQAVALGGKSSANRRKAKKWGGQIPVSMEDVEKAINKLSEQIKNKTVNMGDAHAGLFVITTQIMAEVHDGILAHQRGNTLIAGIRELREIIDSSILAEKLDKLEDRFLKAEGTTNRSEVKMVKIGERTK
jgi:hypothetical protein